MSIYDAEHFSVDDAGKVSALLNERALKGWELHQAVPVLTIGHKTHSVLFIFKRAEEAARRQEVMNA